MGGTVTREVYARMIEEDLRWLLDQPKTLERDHIEQIVKQSVDVYYPPVTFTDGHFLGCACVSCQQIRDKIKGSR